MTARTSYPLSVIIPTRNEEARIGAAIDSAFAAGAAEVLVCDGGSTDDTLRVAEEHGARIVACSPPRGRQLNAGAAAAAHEHLLFLHADTALPPGAAAAVISSNADFGGFPLRFTEPALRLRLAALMITLRTSLTRGPGGDQAQFVRRDRFPGYREIPIREDSEPAARMGPGAILPLYVTTSGRRFLEKGVLRTVLINQRVIAAWKRGVAPEELARIYRE